MFDPTSRLIEEIAAAIDKNATAKLRDGGGLARWARREHEWTYLLLDEDGRRAPLSSEQIVKGAGLAARKRETNEEEGE